MPKQSAGILMFRFYQKELQVLLVHPGGPFFKNKDAGSWSIPKGEFGPGEEPLSAAIREFTEELGTVPEGNFIPLTKIVQKGGKSVFAWIIEGDLDSTAFTCNTFSMEWPPRSGRRQEFPEIDKAEWFNLQAAREKMLESQQPLLAELEAKVNVLNKSSGRT
jgi:predicted NUDIX family NTP pyrophosphohydrolase